MTLSELKEVVGELEKQHGNVDVFVLGAAGETRASLSCCVPLVKDDLRYDEHNNRIVIES